MTKIWNRQFDNGEVISWDRDKIPDQNTSNHLEFIWSYEECLKYLSDTGNLLYPTKKEDDKAQFFADQIQAGGNHYKEMTIQPWAAMEAWLTPAEFIGFLKGNIIKYQARAHSGKGSHAEHMEKSAHYQQKLKEYLQKYPDYPQLETTSAS